MVTTIGAIALVVLWQFGQPMAGGTPVSEQIACAPMSLPSPPVPAIHVMGGYAHGRIMFGPGEPLVVNAGTAKGVQTGQQYFVRRYIRDRFTPVTADFIPHSVHTAGWVTIVDAKDTMAVATVTHACDGVLEGDYLEPFVSPADPPPGLAGAAPDFEHPGQIVMADERRQLGYPGLVMLLNRGSDHGVRSGLALTIYRPSRRGEGPSLTVGTATVLSAGAKLSLVRIETSRDAIHIGDYAAIHRITQ